MLLRLNRQAPAVVPPTSPSSIFFFGSRDNGWQTASVHGQKDGAGTAAIFTPEVQHALGTGGGTDDLSQHRALGPCTPGFT
jgi:hypothetical protein